MRSLTVGVAHELRDNCGIRPAPNPVSDKARLAPHSAHRKLVVPNPETDKPQDKSTQEADAKLANPARRPRLGWAALLARVFGVDATQCACGGKLTVLAAIMDETQIRRILDHMGLPSHVPKFAPA